MNVTRLEGDKINNWFLGLNCSLLRSHFLIDVACQELISNCWRDTVFNPYYQATKRMKDNSKITRAVPFKCNKTVIICDVPRYPEPAMTEREICWIWHFGDLLWMWQCGTPRIPRISSFRAQPADGCDCGWNSRLLLTDRPALAAVLLLPLSTQRRPQVSDRWVSAPLRCSCASYWARPG